MSDSQRSWIGVKGWLDKSSQIRKRLVPRRNSKRDSSTFEPKEVSELPAQRLRNKESPPYYPAPPPSAAPSSRSGQRRMSTSSKQYATGYSEIPYPDDKRRYSQSRTSGPPSSINTDGYPRPRFSKRHSDQQSYATQSASARLDDVDRRLSRRRSKTGELQNGKVPSDRQESRSSNVYSEEIIRRARGAEPIRTPYPDSAPASRGRLTADVVGASRSDKGINTAQEDDLDAGNRLGPPRSSMSKRSSGIPDGFSQSRRLVKRRDSRAGERDELAIHMNQLKLSEGLEKGRTRDRSRSRSRSRSVRELLRSRREDAETSRHHEKKRGRSLSRSSRFSSRSRSVDQRAQRQKLDTELGPREMARRRDSVLSHSGKEHLVMVTKDGHPIRSEHEGSSNAKRTVSRSPSRNSIHSRRHLSRSPSRASLRSQTRAIPVAPQVGMTRRASDASVHTLSGRARPSSTLSRSLPVGLDGPGVIHHSSSRYTAEQEARHMEEESEARRRRRASTALSVENSRVSPTDPRLGNTRGILRRKGRISSFADGPPPRPPPASSTKAEPSRSRRISRSRSGSRSRARKSDEEEDALRNNTIHNAHNLKYQPHRDGYPSSSTSPSGRRGLVPVRYPTSSGGSGRHLPLRRYTTSSVGAMPHIAMPRRPSYLVEQPVLVPSSTGTEMWYQGWGGNGIPVIHDPHADPYGYGVHPSQIPPSHAHYPSWPPDGREAYPQRRGDSGPFMRPGSHV